MSEKVFEINSVDELSQVSDLLISWRDKSNIIAFYGPMGAGKTTLIKNLCHKLGVTDEVNSPTFALVNEYPTPIEGSISISISIASRNWRRSTISATKTISTAADCVSWNGPSLSTR